MSWTHLRNFVGVLCAVLWVSAGYCANVVIVASESSAGYSAAAAALTNELERSTPVGAANTTVSQMSVTQWRVSDAQVISRTKLVVALGTEALRQVLVKNHPAPILVALIPRSGVERVLKEQGRAPASVTAVYLDQPFPRQLALLQLALPEAQRVGVIWGPESIAQRPGLSTAMRSLKLQEIAGIVATGEPLQQALKAVMTDADVLLAVADPAIFNSVTVSNILLATYRAGVPVVAFSPAYARAGALFALYSTPEQVGIQAAVLARTIMLGGGVPASQYPQEYSVEVNENVARSLGFKLDAGTLVRQLRQLENRP